MPISAPGRQREERPDSAIGGDEDREDRHIGAPPEQDPALTIGQSGTVDAVILGHGERTAILRPGTSPEAGDPYNGGDFLVELRAEGMTASRRVFVYGWSDVAGFFADLAENWRGWAGTKTWTSPEYDLAMTATHDAGSLVLIEMALRDGPVHTWSATTWVEVEPGEEMASVAKAVAETIPTSAKP